MQESTAGDDAGYETQLLLREYRYLGLYLNRQAKPEPPRLPFMITADTMAIF